MSKLDKQIKWAVDKFNLEIFEATKKGESLLAAAEKNVGLLFYVRKIYPGRKFPAWARISLSPHARQAVAEYEAAYKRKVL